MTTGSTTWGFIGLGNIGYPMAMNVRKKIPASDRLMVLDANAQSMQSFVDDAEEIGKHENFASIQVANNARKLAEESSVIITSLPSPQIVQSVYKEMLQGEQLPVLETQRLFIDSSTIDPSTSKSVASLVSDTSNGVFVDAPVSGGAVGARAGTLTFMFGAPSSEDLLRRVRSALSIMGTEALHMGEQGTGVCSKLANNYILSINNIAVAEALNMGQRCGLDLRALSDMIKTSTGRCWPIEANNPVPGIDGTAPASNDYEPGGTVGIIKKDLVLAMAGAEAAGAYLALAEKVRQVYEEVEELHGGKDLSVVYQWLQNRQ